MTYAYRYDFHSPMKEGEHKWWCSTIGNTDDSGGNYECGICGKQTTTEKHRPNRMGCKGEAS